MSESTVSGRSDSPAVALGPTALVLGVFSAVGTWVPALVLITFPWTIITGPLAIALGAMGVHHARRGAGRLWIAIVGTALGVIGFGGITALFWSFGG
ncbi:hypothetical protein [Streptomyces iranensis]|uniref:DUF4190 domain-containing protein n=1 Tax=Streptomyces iranensis TaxID=576784 RepID=A0A060ZVQ5_9ACTN|nr:hypothetical protein [Streptomyces iranensis]MBP2067153.1 hypothetical protein [Streptomyces iranensis]CDR07224.1 predicted protein [Streptomyces iranensis]